MFTNIFKPKPKFDSSCGIEDAIFVHKALFTGGLNTDNIPMPSKPKLKILPASEALQLSKNIDLTEVNNFIEFFANQLNADILWAAKNGETSVLSDNETFEHCENFLTNTTKKIFRDGVIALFENAGYKIEYHPPENDDMCGDFAVYWSETK